MTIKDQYKKGAALHY